MKHAVLLALTALLMAMPTVAKAETYPPNVQKAFMSGCESSYTRVLKQKGMASKAKLAKPLCSCVLTNISSKMTLAEFEQLDRGLAAQKTGKPLDPETQKKFDMLKATSSAAAGQCLKSLKM
jgi:hypothetical protein